MVAERLKFFRIGNRKKRTVRTDDFLQRSNQERLVTRIVGFRERAFFACTDFFRNQTGCIGTEQMLDFAILCFHLIRNVEQIFCQRKICKRNTGIHTVVGCGAIGAVDKCLHEVADSQIEGTSVEHLFCGMAAIDSNLAATCLIL